MASESLTNTNISETYVGVLHAKGEALPGAGQVDIYDGFGNKSALSLGQAGKGIDVDGALGSNFKAAIADTIYPVGSVIFSIDNTNPGDRFTGTTWLQVSKGKFIAGVGQGTDNSSDTHTVAAGDVDTTGEYKHQLTVTELPEHTHPIKNSSRVGNDPNVGYYADHGNPSRPQATPLLPDNTGGNQSHNNIPPTFGMYVWQRTA